MGRAIYHVTTGGKWDGHDLLALSVQVSRGYMSEDEAIDLLAQRWDFTVEDAAAYLWAGDGGEVHCHVTLDEAREYAAEYGGEILEIDTECLDVRTGQEYQHPVVSAEIPASACKRL